MKRLMFLAACLFGVVFTTSVYASTMAERSLDKLRAASPVLDDAFDFVVCGDSRSAEPIVLPKEFYTMIREWNVLKPALVVDVGDLILGGPVPDLDPMWKEFEKAIAGCEVPFFPVAGNHDVNPDPAVIKIYEDRIAPLIYAFDYGNSRFIVLNTQEPGDTERLSDAQVQRLKQELQKGHPRHVFLFFHEPLFQDNWERDWSNVADAIKGFPVRAVFAGHVHMYRDCGVRDGVRYVITGGGGAELGGPEGEGGFLHYLLVRVRGDQVTWSVIRPGSVLPEDVVTDAKVATLRELQQTLRSETVELAWGERFDRKVKITFQNPLPDAIAAKLVWSVPAGWHVEPPDSAYSLQHGASTSPVFHVWADTPAAARFPVPTVSTSVQLPKTSAPLELVQPLDLVPTMPAVHAGGPVTVDGVLTEWGSAKAIPMTYTVGYDIKDTNDLQADVRLMWDEGHVYVAVEADDNEFHQPYSGDIVWSADSVEFLLEGYGGSFSLTSQGPQVFCEGTPERHVEAVTKDVALAVKRDGRHVVYEAAFPADQLKQVRLEPDSSYRLSILVNDLDPSGPLKERHYVELTPGAGNHFRCPMVKVILTK